MRSSRGVACAKSATPLHSTLQDVRHIRLFHKQVDAIIRPRAAPDFIEISGRANLRGGPREMAGAGDDEENLKDWPVTLRQCDAGPLMVSWAWRTRPSEVHPAALIRT